MSRQKPESGAPDHYPAALLLIDVINDLEWEGGERIEAAALKMAENIARLKNRAGLLGIPVIYVNDNFGRWRSDFRCQVEHCLEPGTRGSRLVQMLRPGPEDYFVLKPRHSGFHASALDVLLKALGARTLILTGLAGNICVLYTANDAYMHDYELIVPSDCTASNTAEENLQALEQMRRYLKASTPKAADIPLASHLSRGRAGR
ncbi:MAG: isochorismatase family cysteine hydrolase [Verrucomicrobiota bacterium]